MKLISKLKNIHFLSLMGTGGMSLLTFLFTAILYRSLSIKEIGIWFFFQALLSFLDTFRQGFLTTAFVKFYAGATEEKGRQVIGSTWYIAAGITLLLVAFNIPLLFFSHFSNDESLAFFIKYYAINLICSLPMIVAMCIAQGELRFDTLLYIRMCQVILLISFLVILNILKINSLQYLMFANIAATLLTSMLTLVMGWSGIGYFFKKQKDCIREIFNFGKYTVGTSISSSLFGVTDTFVINFMLGPSSLAVYNLGKRLMEVVEIPLRSFVATAMPSLSKAYNSGNKKEVIDIMKKYIGTITICLFPVLVVAYIAAGLAMSIIGGGQYHNTPAGDTAINIFRIFTTFALLYPADRFMSVALDAIHRPQINFIKVIVMLVVNLSADFLGVYLLGNVYGIVIGTFFPTITAIAISYYYINKDFKKFSLVNSYLSGYRELMRFVTLGLKQAKNLR
ncbi:hypothetical protein GCM10022289_16260 [Pedobacter jeongneungensis]|uniref:O-antigen/teichoic acid export membrane protein n=1 Tax=Pedobacter jeongneungensis TaxID=947309 RepID=A0ABP8BAB5_9SPHI